MCAIAWMSDETYETLRFVLDAFKSLSDAEPSYFLIDKDLTEWRVIEDVFPNCLVLLCTFHSLKWLQQIIYTARASSEEHVRLYQAFSSLLYARDEEMFQEKLEAFKEMAEGVEVRASGKESDLWLYFTKNWLTYRRQWAHVDRRGLRIRGENTTNRLESAFCDVKLDLKTSNIGKLPITEAIPQVTQWVELKLTERYTQALRRKLNVFHQDPEIRKQFQLSSESLNELGTIDFVDTVKLMLKREHMMKLVELGVEEKYRAKKGDEEANTKIYDTTLQDCNCTHFFQYSTPCRHVYFLRRSRLHQLFEKDLFPPFLHVERIEDLEREEESRSGPVDQSRVEHDAEELSPVGNVSSEEEPRYWNQLKRFKKLRAEIEDFPSLAALHGTAYVQACLLELADMKENVRNGRSLFFQQKQIVSNREDENADRVEGDTEDHTEIEKDNATEVSQTLIFKTTVRPKGRPNTGGGKKKRFGARSKTQFTNEEESAKENNQSAGDGKGGQKTGKEVNKTGQGGNKKRCDPGKRRVPSLYTRETILCTAPELRGQAGETAVTMFDYSTLAVGSSVSDPVVSLHLRTFNHQFEHLGTRTREDVGVVLFMSEFSVALNGWDPVKEPDPPQFVLNWTEEKVIWNSTHKVQLVVLPAADRGHYYVHAAHLDLRMPVVYVLESIGQDFAKPTSTTNNFVALLHALRSKENLPPAVISVVFLEVPRQKKGSNDCALFAIEYCETICANPEEFIKKAKGNRLGNWFPSRRLAPKRDQLADEIRMLAVDQRVAGGHLAHVPLGFDLPSPKEVCKEVKKAA